MSAISQFADWFNLTRERQLSGPEEIKNDAVLRTELTGALMRDRPTDRVVRGGTHISERVRLSVQDNFGKYIPGMKRQISRRPTIKILKWGWRHYENHFPFTDDEEEFNEGDQLTQFKAFRYAIEQDLYTTHFNGMERVWWVQPNFATMNPIDYRGGDIFSIPAYITEASTGLPPGFTDLCGVSPVQSPEWDNDRQGYDSNNLSDVAQGLFAAFGRGDRRTKFTRPSKGKKYFDDPERRSRMILTNGDGFDVYEQQLRNGNDNWVAGPQDPSYGAPQWKGTPLMWCEAMDGALLEIRNDAFTGNPYPAGQPRYFMINAAYLFPVFHRGAFFKMRPPKDGGAQQDDAMVIWMRSKGQLVCQSRRQHSIIYPL